LVIDLWICCGRLAHMDFIHSKQHKFAIDKLIIDEQEIYN